MFDNIGKMARFERGIKRRMEVACGKNEWVIAVAMISPENTTLHIEK